MVTSPFRISFLIAALALLAAACTSSNSADTTTTAPPTTTTTTTTTTTVPPTTTTTSTTTTTTTTLPPIPSTINGLPAEDDVLERRVVAVKIDNHPKARPQSGLQSADAVYEILVEGGLTRFIALFHQSDDTYVGPNRSGRPTDASIVRPLAGPIQISGAQRWIQNIFTQKDVDTIYETRATSFRIPQRRAPHNLYVDTERMRTYADDNGWPDEPPPTLYIYDVEPTMTDGPAERIMFDWSNHPNVIWEWDGESYLRSNGNNPHEWVDEEGEREQVGFDTLVVLKARRYFASPPGGSGSPVPALDTVGSGEALVFWGGEVVEGTWERGTDEDVIRLFAEDGNDLVLPPGRVWTSVFPKQRSITWE
jgi:hypothetical protein